MISAYQIANDRFRPIADISPIGQLPVMIRATFYAVWALGLVCFYFILDPIKASLRSNPLLALPFIFFYLLGLKRASVLAIEWVERRSA
jgi:hypothetical protein